MIKFLISLFIHDADNIGDARIRAKYGTLSSMVGILCNVLLFALKFILGNMANSIAVTADAFNNLSDVGSALVTFLGFKMASKPADREHPFGHGRIEYISGLIIAGFILLVGFEFVKTSIHKIMYPEPVEFRIVIVVGLVASILVKLWLSRFNSIIGQKIHSTTMNATAMDSISDVMATSVTLVAVVTALFTDLPIDGYMGIVVSGFVLFTGYNVAKDTISPLLGRAPDPELVAKIKEMTLSFNGIIGVHDLIVHDYGPGRVFASLHAEVPITMDIMDNHALIDYVEEALEKELGIEVVIHMDPLDTECELTNSLKKEVEHVVLEENKAYSIHDFRVILSGEIKNLIFDVSVPIEEERSDVDICCCIKKRIKALDAHYHPKIVVDRVLF